MPTLAELRARKQGQQAKLPRTTKRLTLDQDLLADVERLETERNDLRVAAATTNEDGERTGPPAKMGSGKAPKRVAEIEAELEPLYEQIRESEGELLLTGKDGGWWQTWKDDHPPREGNISDARVVYGLCNATDLLNELGEFVTAWDGENLADGDWDGWLKLSIAPGDLRDLVTAVVEMQERSGVRVPKSLSGSSETEPSESD